MEISLQPIDEGAIDVGRADEDTDGCSGHDRLLTAHFSLVTTPHGSRAGGFWNDAGMSSHTDSSFQLAFARQAQSNFCIGWHALTDGWVASAFTRGSLPRNHRNTGELEVGKRTIDLFLHTSQNPERTAARQCGFHPLPSGRGLTPQLVSWLLNFAKARTSRLTSERYHMCVGGVNAQSDSSFIKSSATPRVSGACSHGKPRLPNCATPGMLVAQSPLVRS
jgi:hypothetical protein